MSRAAPLADASDPQKTPPRKEAPAKAGAGARDAAPAAQQPAAKPAETHSERPTAQQQPAPARPAPAQTPERGAVPAKPAAETGTGAAAETSPKTPPPAQPKAAQPQPAKPQPPKPQPAKPEPKPQPAAPAPAKAPGAKPAAAQAQKKPASYRFKPAAEPARLRRRHLVLLASFFFIVVAPLVVIAGYLFTVAEDQYISTSGFTVRAEEGGAATDLLGGLAQFAGGGNSAADGDILYEFITSQELVQRLNQRLDLVAHFSEPYDQDPVFALTNDATMEDLVSHWQNVVRISYNQSNGLIDLQVLAFTPEMAQTLARAIIDESSRLVNELNAQARDDAMRFAQMDLDAAITRMREAREALTRFRTRTQIVDPTSDLQGRMGVLNNLQQQLAQALIEFDLLSENTTNPDDPRLIQASRRIDVIRERIRLERETFTSEDVGSEGEDYPSLMAEFEGLVVDREFAEETYRAALTALDGARTNAARQSRYLAVFINPTLPESSEYPNRLLIVGLSALFLTLGWMVAMLIFYSIRDRQ
jgi:capsular polysaccharide transport system permease protein